MAIDSGSGKGVQTQSTRMAKLHRNTNQQPPSLQLMP